MDWSTPGFPVHHQLPEPTQTHVHWVDDTNHWTKLVRYLNLLSWISYFNRLDGCVRISSELLMAWETMRNTGMKWSEVKLLSHVRLFATPWTVAYKAPQSMEFSRQECWRGLPFPPPGDLPDTGIELGSPALKANTTIWATRKAAHTQYLTTLWVLRVSQHFPRRW